MQGPRAARMESARHSLSSIIASTAFFSVPLAVPRQPAWTAATAPGAKRRTGTQSAVRMLRITSFRVVTAASNWRSSSGGSSPAGPSTIRTSVPCTCFSRTSDSGCRPVAFSQPERSFRASPSRRVVNPCRTPARSSNREVSTPLVITPSGHNTSGSGTREIPGVRGDRATGSGAPGPARSGRRRGRPCPIPLQNDPAAYGRSSWN